ncbi:MAG TPA: hypothetical protein VM364_06775 [Vicinamibacterales bacterium]|nr:hypothetical protein [Vicinamibacterales bacterium]
MTLVVSPPQIGKIATLIHAEFREMPGMRLTEAQIRRLWHLTESECGAVLEHLVDGGRLVRDASGRYTGRTLEY